MILPLRRRERKETQGNVFHLFFWEALQAKDFITKSTKEIHAKNTKGSLDNTDFLTSFEIRASLRHCAIVVMSLRKLCTPRASAVNCILNAAKPPIFSRT